MQFLPPGSVQRFQFTVPGDIFGVFGCWPPWVRRFRYGCFLELQPPSIRGCPIHARAEWSVIRLVGRPFRYGRIHGHRVTRIGGERARSQIRSRGSVPGTALRGSYVSASHSAFLSYARWAALIDPANASPSARITEAVCGRDTSTATSATVTIAPRMLKNLSPTLGTTLPSARGFLSFLGRFPIRFRIAGCIQFR